MFYIHDISSVSPVEGLFDNGEINVSARKGNKLYAREPACEGLPPGLLRRMGKVVRMSVGATLDMMRKYPDVRGIIVGTANGGMEDSIKFMNQIVQYEEGLLSPGNFVQSTPNGIASQIAFMAKNRNYNITHVHRGLSFENALLDVMMQLKENPLATFLVGGADEISTYNFNIDSQAGWYKDENILLETLFDSSTPGSISGEGAAMFLVNNRATSAMARFSALHFFHESEFEEVGKHLSDFLITNLPEGEKIDILLSGENGDIRMLPLFVSIERAFEPDVNVLRFKHLCGEYPTASSFALWLSCKILKTQTIPPQLIKHSGKSKPYYNLLIYNSFQGGQHSFMLISVTE